MKNSLSFYLSAAAAVTACVTGIIYSLNVANIFEILHWYSFSSDRLTFDEFEMTVRLYAIVQLVYYLIFLPYGFFETSGKGKALSITLVIMSVFKLAMIAILFRLGMYMVFQLGFGAAMEIFAFVNLFGISKSEKILLKNPDRWRTVGIAAIIAESIHLLQMIQYIFTDIPFFTKLSVILLPCVTAALLFITAFKLAYPYGPGEISEEG